LRVAAFFCSEDFGELLQDSVSILGIFDGEFALPQSGIEIEKNFRCAVRQEQLDCCPIARRRYGKSSVGRVTDMIAEYDGPKRQFGDA